MSKKLKEGSWESRGAQKARREHDLRNFAAKVSRCENCPPHCEMVSQPPSTLCENFRSCEEVPWHTSSISQARTPVSQLRSLHALNSSILQPNCHFEGCFATAKPPFGIRVPFRSPVHSFRSCEMVAKSPCLKILQHAHHEWKCCSRTPIGHI